SSIALRPASVILMRTTSTFKRPGPWVSRRAVASPSRTRSSSSPVNRATNKESTRPCGSETASNSSARRFLRLIIMAIVQNVRRRALSGRNPGSNFLGRHPPPRVCDKLPGALVWMPAPWLSREHQNERTQKLAGEVHQHPHADEDEPGRDVQKREGNDHCRQIDDDHLCRHRVSTFGRSPASDTDSRAISSRPLARTITRVSSLCRGTGLGCTRPAFPSSMKIDGIAPHRGDERHDDDEQHTRQSDKPTPNHRDLQR